MEKNVTSSYEQLQQDTNDFWFPSSIPILDGPPDPLVFYRDYVSTNRPVLIRNAMNNSSAVEKWKSNEYLCNQMKDTEIHVEWTPNGLADSLLKVQTSSTGSQRCTFLNYRVTKSSSLLFKSQNSLRIFEYHLT